MNKKGVGAVKSDFQREKRQVRNGVKAAIKANKSGRLSNFGLKAIASSAMSWEISRSFEEKSKNKLSQE